MKKLTLFAIALLASAVSFAALNPFAYGLSSKLSADETTLTVNYSLNADATAVSVVILDGETVVKTVDCADKGLTKGAYEVEIPTTDLPKTKSLTWKVEVSGTSVDKPTQESTNYSFWGPRGLAIDKDPESEYFGRILVTESYHPVKDLSNYISSNKGAGIYVFNPDFTTDGNVENGGLDFTNVLAVKTGFMPWRVKISDDGRIFASSLDKNGVVVWEVSKDLKTWTPVIAGTNNATDYNIYDTESDFFAGLNVAMDVQGSGENLKLLLYSVNNKGIAFNQSGYRLDEYALGTAKVFTGKPKNIINGGDFGNVHTDVDFIYDGEGGYWFGGSRAGSDGTPSLVHINSEGVEDYRDETSTFYGGGGLLIHKGMLFKGKDRSTSANGKFGIYTIGKDASGKTTITQKWEVVSTGLGRNHNQFAVDYAENLYVIGNSKEKIMAFALPYSGTVATPAASKYAFQLQEEVVGTFYTVTANANDPAMGEVTGNEDKYEAGATATLTAVPAAGYKFVNWTVGEETKIENPLTLTVNSDLTVTANFVALPQYTITATANDAAMGTVEGAGKYYEGEEVTLEAIANPGHEFVDWNNGATEATLTFAAEKDSAVVANFKKLSYTVTAVVNDDAKGSVSGIGTYEYGATATVEAVAADGYELLYWSDRSTENPRTVTVDGNKVLNAYFIKKYESEPTFKVEKLWENTTVPASTSNGYQAVGWDGKIYMQDAGNKKIVTYASAEDSGIDYATGGGAGQQIAVDEAGNLIVFNATFYAASPNAILIYKKGSTEGKAVSFTLSNPGRCDFFSASGDIYSEEGGYVYFYCQNTTVVNRVKIANGAATAEDVTVDVVGNNITGGNSQNHVMVDIFGNLVAVSRSNAASWINVHTNESSKTFAATLSGIKLSTLGGCTFELGGKELWAYNVGTTAYNSEWNIYNMTDKKFLSEETFYAKNKTEVNSAANWLNVQVVDEKTAYIYQFCPKVAVAVWKVTCDTGEEPGTGTAVDNTPVAPQVQKIIRDGQVLIIRDGKTFNMMGQEVH